MLVDNRLSFVRAICISDPLVMTLVDTNLCISLGHSSSSLPVLSSPFGSDSYEKKLIFCT